MRGRDWPVQQTVHPIEAKGEQGILEQEAKVIWERTNEN